MMTTHIHLPQKSKQLVFFPAHRWPGYRGTAFHEGVQFCSAGQLWGMNPERVKPVMDSLYRLWIRKGETSNSYDGFTLLCWNWTR